VAAVFGCIVGALVMVEPCAGQQIVTAPRGVAIGGNLVGSPVTIGIPPEQLPGIIEAATKDWRNLSDQQKQTIDTLQDKLGVNEDALKAFFAILGEKEVPVEHAKERRRSN
jgi:hypothetical protein